jgi:hypothetical protein
MAEFAWVAKGDKLPAVAVAQLLLKRTGHTIGIDGDFGNQTAGAVRDFQRPRGLSVDGVIGQNTWPRLSGQEQLPILDCIDVFDPDLYTSENRFLTNTGASPVLLGGMSNGIEQAVTEIRRAARGPLFLLRFHGHGNRGIAGASGGHGDLGDHRSFFQNSPPVRAALAQLRGMFGEYGCIQFMHCSTGAGPQGRAFLSMVASATGVPATAAYLTQYASTLKETLRYEGGTRTVCPEGQTLSAWAKSLPEFVGMSVA